MISKLWLLPDRVMVTLPVGCDESSCNPEVSMPCLCMAIPDAMTERVITDPGDE